eukprot:1035423-Pleurochrysis_carterae.AAC.1
MSGCGTARERLFYMEVEGATHVWLWNCTRETVLSGGGRGNSCLAVELHERDCSTWRWKGSCAWARAAQ